MNHTKKKTSTSIWPMKMNYSKLKGKSVAQKVKAIEVRSTFKIVWQDRLKLMTSIKLDKQWKTNLIWKRLRLKVTTSKWNSSIDNHWCSNQDSIQDKNSYQLTMSHLKNRENKKHRRRNVHTWPSKRRWKWRDNRFLLSNNILINIKNIWNRFSKENRLWF